MKRPDLSKDAKKLVLIRPGYFGVRMRLPDGRVTKSLLIWGNPLERFMEPIVITLMLGSGGSTFSSENLESTSGQNSASSSLQSAKNSQPPEEVDLDVIPENSEEDAALMALMRVLDDPPGQLAMLQIFVNPEDAMRLLPSHRGEPVLPLELGLGQKPYQLYWPVPVYTAKGEPWSKLDLLQRMFEQYF